MTENISINNMTKEELVEKITRRFSIKYIT